MGAGGGQIALTPVGWLTYHAHRKATFWQGVYVLDSTTFSFLRRSHLLSLLTLNLANWPPCTKL